MPKDIAIFDLIKVHDDAHARFDATKRTYEYHIHTKKNALQIKFLIQILGYEIHLSVFLWQISGVELRFG